MNNTKVECDITIPKEQIDLLLVQSNIELLQRVNKLVDLLEQKDPINHVLDLLQEEKDKVINCPINFSEQDRFWNQARLKQIEIIENRVKELQGNNHG